MNNIVNVYSQFKLDGIDIDWEYPGQQGEGSNGVSPQDSANFLAMLKLLRSKLPSSARITAAVQDVPFAGPDGNPLKDVSSFAAVLDWVNVMNYDVFGCTFIFSYSIRINASLLGQRQTDQARTLLWTMAVTTPPNHSTTREQR